MVVVVELSKAEFLADYAEGLITEVIYIKDRVYGKSPKGMANQVEPYKVVWASI